MSEVQERSFSEHLSPGIIIRARIFLADDHAIVLEGLRRILESEFDVVGVASDGMALVKSAEGLKPDLVVVDVSMPLLNGIEAARRIRSTNCRTKIVFLSMHSDVAYASKAFQAGGSAYVLKSLAGIEIVTAIREALRGGTFLTPTIDKNALEAQIRRDQGSRDVLHPLSARKRQVLQMMVEGRSTKQIAEVLQISSRTVEFHRYRLMEALGLHTVAELIQYAIRHELVILASSGAP